MRAHDLYQYSKVDATNIRLLNHYKYESICSLGSLCNCFAINDNMRTLAIVLLFAFLVGALADIKKYGKMGIE